ncbi:oxidoreductase [Nakamurella antarctica]|uniref:Oxidoreductase n=1 Tax=Nakamurella antarctica TaxID=1902245 RepID=A0A3G8ZPZ2_9ACTN|nr:oxidoreductase [Nakamurella antarctica]
MAEAVEEARRAVAELRRHPANTRGWAKSAAAAAVRASRASAALDGGDPGIDALAEIVSDPVLAGALRCNSALATMAPIWERAPLQALARLHTLAGADLGSQVGLGRPRPTDPLLGPRLSGLATVAVSAPWPAPIKVAIVHAEVLALQPFDSANGVVGRAAARLTAMCSGLDQQALTVPEVHFFRTEADYRRLLLAYGSGSEDGLAQWLVYCCEALIAGAREGTSIANASRTDGP